MFILLLSLSALLVAGSAAYFSVLGIATLFSGSYYEVMFMAAALELGKLVATSYLYRYWTKTNKLLKAYLTGAVIVLMAITSMGIFGYLSAAYQSNSSMFAQIDSKIVILKEQKTSFDKEIEQNNSRLDTLNASRASQEQRLPGLSSRAAQPIYKDIEKAGEEIKKITERIVSLQQSKTEKDNEIVALQSEISKSKDIGTFKFVANVFDKPLDSVVTIFICVLIGVFDPLAVALVLAFNVATNKRSLFEKVEEPIIETTEEIKQENSSFDKRKIKLGSVIASGGVKNS
jgi:hypothetical protein